MSENLTIGQNEYKIGRMFPILQFHVARRLAPLLKSFGSLASLKDQLQPGSNQGKDPLEALGPIAEVLASMPDADVNYIIANCLDVIQRNQKDIGRWVRINAKGTTNVVFDDIDMMAMLQLSAAVIMENLAGFFPAGEPASPPAPAT